MTAAIVYFSLNGFVDAQAREISRETGAELIRLEPKTPYPTKGLMKFLHGGKSALKGDAPELKLCEFDASRYDLVIFGTPVWAGTFAPPLRTFIQTHREALKGKRLAAFACMMGSGGEKTVEKLREALGADSLAASVILTDDKGKSQEKNAAALQAFIRQCRASEVNA